MEKYAIVNYYWEVVELQAISDSKLLEKKLREQLGILEFGAVDIVPQGDFVAMLRQSLASGTPLRVKCGIDPTRTDVHLGHFVPYRKMRAFQDLGHTGVVVIGDYTARIGDPTGKDESRPALTPEQVEQNCKFYQRQLLRVLDSERTEFRYQSEWFGDANLSEVLSWAGQTTVAKLISHETFAKRIQEGLSLGLHELLYPVLQGIDSVKIQADVELGGSDQRFNVLMGRDYQRHAGQRPQCAMLTPIVTGLDGRQKMSSSLDNYISADDPPFEMYGKVMSAPDSVMLEYFQYLAWVSPEEYQLREREMTSGELHPNEAKKQLAAQVVALYHGPQEGQQQREQFERVFAQKKVPDQMDSYQFSLGQSLLEVMVDGGLVPSKAEARRMLSQGGVSLVDGDKLRDPHQQLGQSFAGQILKVGKRRFIKLLERAQSEDSIEGGPLRFPLPPEASGPKSFALFSDGACRGNPGPGAWGSLGQDGRGQVIFESNGVEFSTTNNRMEMEGACACLRELENYLLALGGRPTPQEATAFLYSDSKYLVDGMNEWIHAWKARDWRKADKKPPENLQLWQQLDELRERFWSVEFHWVKGHHGHPQNEYCDQLANRALDEMG